MTVEVERTRRKPLVGGALIFSRVERFIRSRPDLKPNQVAELAKLTRDFLDAEAANRPDIRHRLNATMRTLRGKRSR